MNAATSEARAASHSRGSQHHAASPTSLTWGRFSREVHPGALCVEGCALTLICALALAALSIGELHIPLSDVAAAITGTNTDFSATVVTQWRLPRIVGAIVSGAALGVTGAIFQTLTRNPLGSPDILGFSTGAYTGALVVLIVLGGSWSFVTVGALTGGLATAALIAFITGGNDSVLRLVLIGVGVSAMLTAVNHWLISVVDIDVATSASMFGHGDLNGISWSAVFPAACLIAALLALSAVASRPLRVLELGGVHAVTLGVPASAARRLLTCLGLALVAIPTGFVGPIAFVALMAPNIARRLTGAHGIDLRMSATLGAALLLGSDLLAQLLIAPAQLPVGLVTGCIGGLYLIYLVRQARH